MIRSFGNFIRNSVINNSTIIGNNTSICSINGTTYVNGVNLNEKLGIEKINSIDCSDGKFIINGKDYTKEMSSDNSDTKMSSFIGNITIEIRGNCGDICTSGKVNVDGNSGNINTNGSVSVCGDVNGDIDTNGSVTVGGSVSGDIDSNGSVTIGKR